MSKGREIIKKVVHANKGVLQIHLLSLGLLLLAFVVCRYVPFGIDGMKEWGWPVDLLLAGIVALLILLIARKKYAPWFIPAGYFLGFLLGVLFYTEGTDPGGGKTDNLWQIWTLAFLAFILIGIVTDTVIKWYRLLKRR